MHQVVYHSLEAAYQDGAMIREDAPTIGNESLAACREILTDERLDYLADRYITRSVRHYTGVPFHKYLHHPEHFDRMAEHMRKHKQVQVELKTDSGTFVAHTMN